MKVLLQKSKEVNDMTFEECSKRLNEISVKLESGSLGIDESMSLFEESVTLSKECMRIINQKKGKILELKKELNKFTEQEVDDV